MSLPIISCKRHRFPPAIIAHAVWLYFRFPLSLRRVEETLLERGIAVPYETVRHWVLKFGQDGPLCERRNVRNPWMSGRRIREALLGYLHNWALHL